MARAEAARQDGIDVVAVVTPNHLHHPVAKAFLEAGIHVICDKPMTTTVEDAEDLAALVERSGLVFALTHNYSGYPLVRQARAMVAEGRLGKIRVVQVEYPQDWLTTALEATGQKQAAWRTDPARSGVAGCVGDIGTHAFQLAEFVTGLRCTEVAADLSTFVEGRRLDDNANMMLRYDNGARGMLWASQVAPGHENGLRLRVYGDKGGIEWFQEQPNALRFAPFGEPPRIVTRGGAGSDAAAAHGTRTPSGHPEGYLEGFANLYRDAADLIAARMAGSEPDPQAALVPGVRDGVRGVRFIHAAVDSSRRGAGWVAV
ncbi:Gfo/Idh/MocA family oxidoreductase [Azospirillum thermophilum]|uniref:Gfo/Idh/MocA family protein n=1 Tax=Azospirillum thermophilum TaxID=2202148 RepID=UPI00269DBC3C